MAPVTLASRAKPENRSRSFIVRHWMRRSRVTISRRPGRWILTTACRPSGRTQPWTWATDAAESGSSSNEANSSSTGRPRSASMAALTVLTSSGSTSRMVRRAASDSTAGQMLGDEPRSWPSLMNIGPSSQKASTTPVRRRLRQPLPPGMAEPADQGQDDAPHHDQVDGELPAELGQAVELQRGRADEQRLGRRPVRIATTVRCGFGDRGHRSSVGAVGDQSSSVGHPAPVESERHPLGERHRGHRRGAEVAGVEDHEVAAVAAGVVDVGQDVAVVLAGAVGGGNEHAFPGRTPGAEAVLLAGAGDKVVLHQGRLRWRSRRGQAGYGRRSRSGPAGRPAARRPGGTPPTGRRASPP